jgi:hypothetical protein
MPNATIYRKALMHGYGVNFVAIASNNVNAFTLFKSFFTNKVLKRGRVGYLRYQAKAYGKNQVVLKSIRPWGRIGL